VESIHHTGKLDEETVTCRFDQPAIVRSDRRIKQFGPDRLERLKSAPLIRPMSRE
jgi:hypothetical protein